MRKLTTEQRAAILTALVEGNSIASTCRMLGVNKITVLRLLADAGRMATDYHDLTVRNLNTKRVQMDEIWAFVHAKDKNVPEQYRGVLGHGDVWTWAALDADSKLAINWLVAHRDSFAANRFVRELADRLADRVQLTSDGLIIYREAVKRAFGVDVDFARLMKEYALDRTTGGGRYSPPVCIAARPMPEIGNPDEEHISTSFIERSNLTMRMSMRRFTRLTNAFSKKLDNHKAAIALHYFHYNFIRKHMTIKTTPAVMAGIADKVWTMVDFVKLMEKEEELLGGRLTDYKPAA